MIYDASTLPSPLRMRADLIVIGSGPGGATVAATAAQAGLKVVVLEAGAFIPPSSMVQREELMLPHLLAANGSRTTEDRGLRIHQGRALGGSAVHNTNLCKRIPLEILREWLNSRGLEHLSEARWADLYDRVEADLSVTAIPEAMWSVHNRILARGAAALGWRHGGLHHNRTGCLGSGFCELGCAYDAKNNAAKVYVPRAVDAGADFLCHAVAMAVLHDRGRVQGVRGAIVAPRTRQMLGAFIVEAPRVCVSASATGTPAILKRSEIEDISGMTGRTLKAHPAVVAAGDFEEEVRAWEGIPQSVECTELLDFSRAHRGGEPPPGTRVWIVPAFAHPVGTATMMPGIGAEHRNLMGRYGHLAVLTAMLHDRTPGRVKPRGELDLTIDLTPDAADRAELGRGLVACTRLLLAAGARRVVIPTDPPIEVHDDRDLDQLAQLAEEPGRLDLVAVHPMGSVAMGDDPEFAPVDSRGRHYGLAGLWVGDGSLFPTSIGVPPQISIYAMGLHVGEDIASGGGMDR